MERPTEQEVRALADAVWQVLDDFGERGQCVCEAAKAQLRIAFEPFKSCADVEPEYPLHEAVRVVSELQF